MAIAEITIVPLGTGTPSVSRYVAACHEVLKKEKSLKIELTPMSTIVEGELDLILAAVRKMHEIPFTQGAQRVSTTLRIDDRRDKELTMAGKLAAVEEKLKHI